VENGKMESMGKSQKTFMTPTLIPNQDGNIDWAPQDGLYQSRLDELVLKYGSNSELKLRGIHLLQPVMEYARDFHASNPTLVLLEHHWYKNMYTPRFGLGKRNVMCECTWHRNRGASSL